MGGRISFFRRVIIGQKEEGAVQFFLVKIPELEELPKRGSSMFKLNSELFFYIKRL